MFKILPLIYLLVVLCSSNSSYGNDNYKIIIKVNDQVVTNHDITKEKSYLSALNPQILNIPEKEFEQIAKQSLIREIIKEKEVLKYYDVDYDSSDLSKLAKNLYKRLNINSVEEFEAHLEKYDLKLKDVLKKLAIEANWNALIYKKYKDQLNIDKDKIKNDLELQSSVTKIEKLFLLSEIVFMVKNKKEYEDTYKKIVDTIKEKDFKAAATIYSSSDTAKFGGEIGWVGKNDISKKIYKQISTLKINEFTKPFKIGTGFLLINLDNIKEELRENNIDEQYNSIVYKETNRQLNQYSTIYYTKIEQQSFIYED